MATSPFRLTESLSPILGGSFYLSPRPDHPHLALSPDVLAGGDGLLTAIFILKSSESESELLARLGTSRLALPRSTRCILILQRPEFAESYSHHFHQIFAPGDIRWIAEYIIDKDASSKRLDIPLEIVSKHRMRYQRLFRISNDEFLTREKGQVPSLILSEVYEMDSYAPRFRRLEARTVKPHLLESNLENVGLLGFTPSESDRIEPRILRRFFVNSFHHDYAIDNGVPYPINPMLNILVVASIPYAPFDPMKNVRAAAFSGWAVGMFDSASDLYDSLSRVSASPVWLEDE